jgi:hypothetical protein
MPPSPAPLALSLLLFTVGCMEHKIHSDSVGIEIVSSARIDAAMKEASARLGAGHGKSENWQRLHESLKSVLAQYGTVTWNTHPMPDFYFSGDWFHENSDSFAICSAKKLSGEMLLKLQRVVAAHDKIAMLVLNGIEDPVNGLEILVTSTSVLVGWQDLTSEACEKRLREIDVTLK